MSKPGDFSPDGADADSVTPSADVGLAGEAARARTLGLVSAPMELTPDPLPLGGPPGAATMAPLSEEPTLPLTLDAVLDAEVIPVVEATPAPVQVSAPSYPAGEPRQPLSSAGPVPSPIDQKSSGEVGEVSDDELEIVDTPGPVVTAAPPAAGAVVATRPPAPPRTAAPPPPVPPPAAEPSSSGASATPPPVPLLPAGAAWSEALSQRSRKKRSKPWFEEVFDEDYLRTLPFMTPEQTLREVNFIRDSLNPPADGQLLDVGCGYGRHAIELGQRGLKVTGIDLSLPLLIRAADESQRRALSVNFVHADMREMAFDGQFDGAYCMLTTFGYFDEETNLKVAASMCRALKPGGRLLLETVNRDYIVGDLPTRVWWEGDGCVVLEEVDFNYHTSRLTVRRSVVFQDGRQLEHDISIRAYSLHELGKLLRQAGLRVLEVSGSLATRGNFFGSTSRGIIVLCERPVG